MVESTIEKFELMKIGTISQMAPLDPFQKTSWSQNPPLPDKIKSGIVEELDFIRPKMIQAVSIPLITTPQDRNGTHQNLIAQSYRGSGKTGAYVIGSVMRVQPSIEKPQVICIAHNLELADQITDVYKKVTNFTDIKISNLCDADSKWQGNQIIVTTRRKLLESVQSRKDPIDLTDLKMVIIDEADVFFIDERNTLSLKGLNNTVLRKLKQKIQWLIFSSTYPDSIKEPIQQLVTEAFMIQILQSVPNQYPVVKSNFYPAPNQQLVNTPKNLSLQNIKQFVIRMPSYKKSLEFLAQDLRYMPLTQTLIFLQRENQVDAIALRDALKAQKIDAVVSFGENERDSEQQSVEREDLAKFREGKVRVMISCNPNLAQEYGDVDLIINYEVPFLRTRQNQRIGGDSNTYRRRAQMLTGTGLQGAMITFLHDDKDRNEFFEIIDFLKMSYEMTVTEAKNATHLMELFQKHSDGDD